MNNKNCIIITRPLPDANETASFLDANKIEYFIEPVIEITIIKDSKTPLEKLVANTDGIIVTSKNALRALINFGINRSSMIILLGRQTSEFAVSQGFGNTEFAGDDVKDLCEYIKANHNGKNFIYASGKVITQELNFANCGANIERIEVYDTIQAASFSAEFIEKITAGIFCGVIFYSSQTAKIFNELINKNGLGSHKKNLVAICFSEKIASSAKSYGFKATMHPKNAKLDEFQQLIVNFWFS